MAILRTINRNGQTYVLADHEPKVERTCDGCREPVDGIAAISAPLDLTVGGFGEGQVSLDAHPQCLGAAVQHIVGPWVMKVLGS